MIMIIYRAISGLYKGLLFLQATCCGDGVHCCPEGMECNLDQQLCTSGILGKKVITPMKEKQPSNAGVVPVDREHCVPIDCIVCPDHVHMCADGQTCCQMGMGQWGCCEGCDVSTWWKLSTLSCEECNTKCHDCLISHTLINHIHCCALWKWMSVDMCKIKWKVDRYAASAKP